MQVAVDEAFADGAQRGHEAIGPLSALRACLRKGADTAVTQKVGRAARRRPAAAGSVELPGNIGECEVFATRATAVSMAETAVGPDRTLRAVWRSLGRRGRGCAHDVVCVRQARPKARWRPGREGGRTSPARCIRPWAPGSGWPRTGPAPAWACGGGRGEGVRGALRRGGAAQAARAASEHGNAWIEVIPQPAHNLRDAVRGACTRWPAGAVLAGPRARSAESVGRYNRRNDRRTFAIAGIKVVELGTLIAGPYCSRLLRSSAPRCKGRTPARATRCASGASSPMQFPVVVRAGAHKKSVAVNLKDTGGRTRAAAGGRGRHRGRELPPRPLEKWGLVTSGCARRTGARDGAAVGLRADRPLSRPARLSARSAVDGRHALHHRLSRPRAGPRGAFLHRRLARALLASSARARGGGHCSTRAHGRGQVGDVRSTSGVRDDGVDAAQYLRRRGATSATRGVAGLHRALESLPLPPRRCYV